MPRFQRCNRLPAARTLKPQVTVSALIESALVRPRASLSGTDAVAQLADDMRRSETATRADLETMGWDRDQLNDTLIGKARVRAQRLAGASV
jgi:hypothetical protein